jgi:pyridoxamine 5'-phosphate oxidase family protein
MEFTEGELEYLRTQPLARVATVSSDGQPDVSPVGFRFDGEHVWIMGNEKIAIVVDDLVSRDPWRPRMLKLFGRAEIVERDGRPWIRISPERKWSFGMDGAS